MNLTFRRPVREHSPARRKRTFAALQRTFSLLALFIGLLSAFVFAARDSSLRIQEIEVAGNETIGKEGIISLVKEGLAGYTLYVIPRESILFYPRSSIEEKLREAFPRLRSVTISIQNTHAVKVSLIERVPSYLWCGEEQEAVTIGCHFLDAEGFIFGRAPTFSGSALTRFYGVLEGGTLGVFTGTEETVGKRFLPPSQFLGLHSFLRAVRELSLTPSVLVKQQDGDYELYLKEGGKILFPGGESAERLSSNLESALAADPLKKQMAEKRASLDYLDLRFGNKVFFKFK